MVASMSLKTPTAVADFLIDRMASAENELNVLGAGIRDGTRIIIEENKNRLETYGIKLLPSARMMISASKEKLSGKMMELIRTGRENTSRSGVVTATLLSRLFSSVKAFSSERKKVINASRENLISSTLNTVSDNRIKLTGLDKTLNILNPINVLRRGYTITSYSGKILKNRNSVKKDDLIDTLFTDGTIKSKVVDPTNSPLPDSYLDPSLLRKEGV